MELHLLPKQKNFQKKAKIVGRGTGSGKGGHTTGRGMNGQMARSGAKLPSLDFEGGQNRLSRRLPKLRGFKSFQQLETQRVVIQSSFVNKNFKEGDEVTVERLQELGAFKTKQGKTLSVKILKDVAFDKNFTFKDIKVSKSLSK